MYARVDARRLAGPPPRWGSCVVAARGRARPSGVGVADGPERPPGEVLAVGDPAGGLAAHRARRDVDGLVGERHRHALVEDVEVPLPQPAVAALLAVAHDATVELVDLVEPARAHQAREHLAADASGA